MSTPSIAVYSSSPPLYSGHSTNHARSPSPVDSFDFKPQLKPSSAPRRPVRGGLSCLFAKQSGGSSGSGVCSPAEVVDSPTGRSSFSEVPSSRSSRSSFSGELSSSRGRYSFPGDIPPARGRHSFSGEPSTSREYHIVGSAPVNIPVRERSPVSVLFSESPVQSSPASFSFKDTYLSRARAHSEIFCDPLVVRAFNVAATAHEGQWRRNGEPYLAHCVETAMLLAEVCPDKTVVAAGLLHDVLDDTMMTEERLRQMFSEEVVHLVIGVSKVGQYSQLVRSSLSALSSLEMDHLRTMFLAMTDVRVVLIKLADRLHNLRTLDALPAHKQQGIAKETLEVFAPLARRLGVWLIKGEMEDLCFKYLNPVEFDNLKARLEEGMVHERSVKTAMGMVGQALRDDGVDVAGLSGRPKNLYSIHKKMESKGRRSLDDIYDLRALRIIVPDNQSCYEALEAVHRLWTAVPTRFKDYIKSPKPNGYQSLHTVVRDDDGCTLEVQIRTAQMHRDAEFGVAAHWKYKEDKKSKKNADYASRQVDWARWMISWYLEVSSKVESAEETGGGAVRSLGVGPLCPFPEHEGACPFAGMESNNFALPALEDQEAPVLIIEQEGDKTTVRELPAGSTAGDLVNDRIKRGLPPGAIARPLINCEMVESAGQPLKTGDMVELVLEYRLVPEIESQLIPAREVNKEVLERKASIDFRKKLMAMNLNFKEAGDIRRDPPTPRTGAMAMT